MIGSRRGGPGGRDARGALTVRWGAVLLLGAAGALGPAGASIAVAQPVPPWIPIVRNAEAFAPLDLHPPSETRLASGAPGEAYWQQRADYSIQARLDPKTHRITGSETIVYTNHSPDSIRSLWLQLDQNLFRPGSPEAAATPEDSRFAGAFRGGGFDIAAVAVTRDGRRREARPDGPDSTSRAVGGGDGAEPGSRATSPEVGAGASNGLVYRIDGTVMELRLDEPLTPGGGRLELHIDFAFTVPENGGDRMGRLDVDQGMVYQIAQWYPRMFVYDDVSGWNTMPYLGQGEFYLEYGTFEVELTLPREFVVVATGVLQNPEEVYTEEQRERLERARGADEAVSIIERREVRKRTSRPAGEGPLTWRFRAEDVRDFAWSASEAFLLDAAAWNDVLVLAAYPREGLGEFGPGWERATEYMRHSLEFYSEQWHPYPYPVAIGVAGRVIGMEYPMIFFSTVRAQGGALFAVTDHEVAHSWLPMLVGTDERRHAWMDEGFVQFMGVYSAAEFTGERSPGDPTSPESVARQMGADAARRPILTDPDRLTEDQLGFLAYYKPAAALLLLRDYVLGSDRFDPAFRAFIDRWKEKHPQPADFFRTMEDVSGDDLDWFFRGWFASTGRLDQAVADVRTEGEVVTVVIENRDEILMPLEVRFIYRDGGDECRRVPVEAWLFGDTWTTRIVGRTLQNVQLDPRGVLPDVNSANDVWGRGIVVRRESC